MKPDARRRGYGWWKAIAWGSLVVSLPARSAVEGPRIQLTTNVVDFGEVKSGEVVTCDFSFTNVGDQVLEILDVEPGCGCTTATEGDRRVPPGQSGHLPIQFNSTGFAGKLSKSIHLLCNDASRSNLVLRIQGTVWTPVHVEPRSVVFQYDGESAVAETKVVTIKNHTEELITIDPPRWTNALFRVELNTVDPGREFALRITPVPPLGTGVISAPITLRTSVTDLPPLKVQVYAFERPPVLIVPKQIQLPADHLADGLRHTIVIRNQSKDALSLSDPEVDLPGVTCELRELQPGRLFNLIAEFPAGFELSPGTEGELRVRSTHPRYPLIQVPVTARGLRAPVPTDSVEAESERASVAVNARSAALAGSRSTSVRSRRNP